MSVSLRTCAGCGTANEADARFCEGCGTGLARTCAACGAEANATARFCRFCGARLPGAASAGIPTTPARKTVSVLFADLAGSTSFEERVDAETAREVIGRYHALLRATAESHRAGVVKYIGDGFMAVWGVPDVGAADADRAVEAAVELQERFVDLAAEVAVAHGVELALRVAVNTGEVVVGADDADLVGDALNVGARLESQCPRGDVVVGEETWRSTRGHHRYEAMGDVQVRGRIAPVAAYRWLGRATDSADATPFVGRTEEIARLRALLDLAVRDRCVRMATVIGDPGVGKSRLAAEFIATQPDACVLRARCDAEGTVALAPVVETLRGIDLDATVPSEVVERDRLLRGLNGAIDGMAGSVEETFWALRRFVEVSGATRPMILVLDDIQWAGPLLLDFVEHLVEWTQDTPVLILALARNEIREVRPDLAAPGRCVADVVALDGLDADATAALAATVLGAAALPPELLRRLPTSTGGNPLFVRELIGMLAHDGVLVEQLTGWRLTIDVDAIAVPPTIHALLASRLERIEVADRRLLEVASVIGGDFSPSAVTALSGADGAATTSALNRLRRLELAQPSGAYSGDEPVWRFHHVLIRDVAYRRLLKSDRADLHQRYADWVQAGAADPVSDADETIARHLEAAHSYRRELGADPSDLALRAARHYAASARRALDRDELISAGTQAARGAALAADDAAVRAELLLVGCEAFLSAGDVAAGAPLVDELERLAGDPLRPWATCYRCQLIAYTDPQRLLEVDALLQEAVDEFGRRQDAAGLAKAHRVRAGSRARLGRIGDCEADLFEALIAARRSGDHRQITAALGAAPGAALWGPSPVPKAGGRCLDVLRMQRMTTAAPSLEATSLRCLAVLELLRGRPGKARAMLSEARQVVADVGLRHGLMETELYAGLIEAMDGDPVAAEPHFRTAMDGLDALGVGADAGQAAALLARAVLTQGRIDEADRYATRSEQIAGRNLKTAIAWRAVRAEILSAQGRHDEAVAAARDAVAVAAGTDLVLDHAEACLALSRVQAAAGDGPGARDAHAEAERLYAAKEVAPDLSGTAVSGRPGSSPTEPARSRLAVANHATGVMRAVVAALRHRDVDAAMDRFAGDIVFDDHRRLAGDAITDMRAATERVLAHYHRFEWRALAVRGERLHLSWSRWSDDDGNETTHLHVQEIDDAGRIAYEGRFDDDDFNSASRDLDRRYYAGEGAVYAANGLPASEAPRMLAGNDFDRLFGELCVPELTVENRSRRAFPDRSSGGLRASFEELNELVTSTRVWISAVRWLSPTWSVTRLEREAIGSDGQEFAWSMLLATGHRDGHIVTICEFDSEDEDAAFAYAEERVRTETTRLAVTNRSCAHVDEVVHALRTHDVEGALAAFAPDFVYDDRRRLAGAPVVDRSAMRAAIERVFAQFTLFENRVLAVCGEHLHLAWTRWTDDRGNTTETYYVNETDDEGRVRYQGRFDGDDFLGAYRELQRRYYAGEAAEFAEAGAVAAEYMAALTVGDTDRAFGMFSATDYRFTNRSSVAFPDPAISDLQTSFGHLRGMVDSARVYASTGWWLSPHWSVSRLEQEAVGPDGERYAWTWIAVSEIHDGKFTSTCLFDPEDEDAAFAYAEEQVRAAASRLAVSNRATRVWSAVGEAMQAHDAHRAAAMFADGYVYDDHWAMAAEAPGDVRAACEQILGQYSTFDGETLAVRGDHLQMSRTSWSNDSGFETRYLHVIETDADDRVCYYGRFDEDDFDGAYRELTRRYCAGEGAEFAEATTVAAEVAIALSNGDVDRAFDDLIDPSLRVENRSARAFSNRTAAELRATFEDLSTMVASVRSWHSVEHWLTPTCGVVRFEREAAGEDGERYAWTRLVAAELRHGRCTHLCEFDLDDEDAAFAYAEELARTAGSRLAVSNRASRVNDALVAALRAGDVEGATRYGADTLVYHDRRSLSGGPVVGADAVRSAIERTFEQYSDFATHTLAVRGERLVLAHNRRSNEDGYQSGYLRVAEVDDDGRFVYDARFDEDDFDGAYRELEARFYAREGADFADVGTTVTEYILALNRGAVDFVYDVLTSPDYRLEDRSRGVLGERSAAVLRTSEAALRELVASTHTWQSAIAWVSPSLFVGRCERAATGYGSEPYAWSGLVVGEIHDGRFTSSCLFDPDDEDAAFAYAEARVRRAENR